jgi:hypothetical protein
VCPPSYEGMSLPPIRRLRLNATGEYDGDTSRGDVLLKDGQSQSRMQVKLPDHFNNNISIGSSKESAATRGIIKNASSSSRHSDSGDDASAAVFRGEGRRHSSLSPAPPPPSHTPQPQQRGRVDVRRNSYAGGGGSGDDASVHSRSRSVGASSGDDGSFHGGGALYICLI